jgi:hypothetical protein
MSRWSREWDEARGRDVEAARSLDYGSPRGRAPLPSSGPPAGPLPGGPRGLDAADAGLVRLIFPPRLEKLVSSQDFNVQDYAITLAAGVGQTATSAALRFQVPSGQVGWLQQAAIYALTPTAATLVQWTIRINGGPVPGFDNLQLPPGIANFVLIGFDDMRVRIPNGALVDVLITNLGAGGPWTVGGSLSGWYHPDVAEKRAWNLDL